MARQPWFFNLDVRRTALPAAGDGLERLAAVVDFELFRAELDVGLDVLIAQGGRTPYDAVFMFQIRDRHSFMRFLGWRCTIPCRTRRAGCFASN